MAETISARVDQKGRKEFQASEEIRRAVDAVEHDEAKQFEGERQVAEPDQRLRLGGGVRAREESRLVATQREIEREQRGHFLRPVQQRFFGLWVEIEEVEPIIELVGQC